MRHINVNYKTINHQRQFGNKIFVLEAIRSLDEAIDDLCEVLTQQERSDPFAEDLCPYFGILWPSSEALSLFLSQNPKLIKNKSVLELGAGLGLPSLVATHLGANVLATDFHPDVEKYFKRNCRHSDLDCEYARLNWRDDKSDIGLFDIVMGSDVLYENKHPSEVAKGLTRFLKPNGHILLTDPGRNYLQPFLEAMKQEDYTEQSDLIKVGENEIFVFLFSKTTEEIE